MYQRLSVPATTPDRVERLIKDHVDMQFRDVHCMLRLPMVKHDLLAGCNFAAASTLLALIAGASVVLHMPEDFYIDGNRGVLFKGLLESGFSWLAREPAGGPSDTADRLWKFYRNTLAHTFGVLKPGAEEYKIIRFKEDGLTEEEVSELERPGLRPLWLLSTLERIDDTYKLNVEPLYWGARWTFENLLQDASLMARVDALLEDLEARSAGGSAFARASARRSGI